MELTVAEALLGLSPAATPAAVPVKYMPAFSGGTHAHLHTVDSALVSLAMLGVPQHRIQLRRAGRQLAKPGTVVLQRPAAGEPLTASTMVELEVAGLGFSHALPVGMWDSGGETHAGTREILESFDDPLEKLKHWFHEGAPLFRIAPDDPESNARWLALFGVEATRWPRSMWFRLASLIARMAQLSCSESGCALVLQVLLNVPVRSFKRKPTVAELPLSARSGLGRNASKLGVDLLMGSQAEGLSTLVIELGPVPLATYEHFAESAEGAQLLRQTLAMVMPASSPYEIAWSVQDQRRAPRLGMAEHNARLGINTHLGDQLGAVTTSVITELAEPEPGALELALAHAVDTKEDEQDTSASQAAPDALSEAMPGSHA